MNAVLREVKRSQACACGEMLDVRDGVASQLQRGEMRQRTERWNALQLIVVQANAAQRGEVGRQQRGDRAEMQFCQTQRKRVHVSDCKRAEEDASRTATVLTISLQI